MRAIAFLLALLGGLSSAQASVRVQVDIGSQTMRVTASSGESYLWRISTGRWGYRTPNGVYRPQRLERFWRSRRYGMAPMPYSVFFRGGYAIHGTSEVGRLGRPASHGCIRLHPGNAATLFNLVRRHSMAATRIEISGSRRDLERPPAVARAPMRRAPRMREAVETRRPLRRPAPIYYYYQPAMPYGGYYLAQ